jgi:hypothetical protein
VAIKVKRCTPFFPKKCPIFSEIVILNPGKGSLIAGYIEKLLRVQVGTEACCICGEASQCKAI